MACCAPEHDYPRRSRLIERFFAWFLAQSEGAMDRAYGPVKRDLFAGLSGNVLEIGPGTGVNFPYYPKDIHLVGIEPNPFTFPRLRAHADACGVGLTLLDGVAERIPVEDNSVDVIVSTLVLCSVYEPDRVVAEILRALRPGGRFLFLEHVAAPEGTLTRRAQRALRAPWRCAGDGCNLDRETWTTIQAGGFSAVDLAFRDIRTPFQGLIRRHIVGHATK